MVAVNGTVTGAEAGQISNASDDGLHHLIRVRVNGVDREIRAPSHRLLVDLLRYDLGLTGTKEGCSIGVCGICTVLMDGKMISACLTPAVFVDGHEILTIEGVSNGNTLTPVQAAFVEHGGYQCGICTPGQIISATALLAENPRPTADEIRAWMMGNLCRCTGYYKIIESILAAAEAQNDDKRPESSSR